LGIKRDKLLEEYKNGNICISTIDGIYKRNLCEFIKQSVNGLLYDLNRNEAVVLSFIDNPKWINDYAVCKVIRALKSKIDELEAKIHKLEEIVDELETVTDAK